MIGFKLSYLHQRAAERPAGYVEACLAAGKVEGDTISFEDEAYHALVAQFRPARPAPAGHWGPALWADLHRIAAAGKLTPAWLETFAARLPDGSCACRTHWSYLLKKLPPPVDPKEQFAWSWQAHNDVNARLGRPSLTLAEAAALYPLQGAGNAPAAPAQVPLVLSCVQLGGNALAPGQLPAILPPSEKLKATIAAANALLPVSYEAAKAQVDQVAHRAGENSGDDSGPGISPERKPDAKTAQT